MKKLILLILGMILMLPIYASAKDFTFGDRILEINPLRAQSEYYIVRTGDDTTLLIVSAVALIASMAVAYLVIRFKNQKQLKKES